MLELIKRCIFAIKYKRAVKKAIRLHEQTGMKYLVIYLNGAIKIVPRKNIKKLIAMHRFKKGVKIGDIEKRALFITK